jgi:outer membrane protein assembly factor BamB
VGSPGEPSISFRAPEQGALLSGRATVHVSVRPFLRLQEVTITGGGTIVEHWTDFPIETITRIDTTRLPEGTVELRAEARYSDGAVVEAVRAVQVDNSLPEIRFVRPQAGETVFLEDGPFGLEVEASDPSGLSRGELRVDDEVVAEFDPVPDGPLTATIAPADHVSDSMQAPVDLQFTAEFTDQAGKTNTASTQVTLRSRLKWRFPVVGSIQTPPAVLPDGAVSVATLQGRLYVIEPDGTERCNWSAGGSEQALSGPVPTPSGEAVVWGSTQRLRMTSTRDCQPMWSHGTRAQWLAQPLVASDGTVYATTFEGVLHSIDPDSGTSNWSMDLTDQSQSSTGGSLSVKSAGTIAADGTVLVGATLGSQNGELFAVNPDGSVAWTAETPAIEGGLIENEDGIFFGGSDGRLYAFDSEGSRAWNREPRIGSGVNARCRPGRLTSGAIVGCDQSGVVAAFDASEGAQIWSKELQAGDGPTGVTDGGMTVGPNGRAFVGDVVGLVHAFDDAGNVLWTYETFAEIIARPAVGEETLYVGSEDQRLYAIRTGGSIPNQSRD